MTSLGEMIEAIYAAPVDGGGWRDVMRLVHRRFESNMEAFYFLDFAARRPRIIEMEGISTGWLEQFSPMYFSPDNPWARYTSRLHRTGNVRTDLMLAEHTGDPQILRRSAYFNEWMRPQYFTHTIGLTPYSQDRVVANLSLFRPPDMAPFGEAEIADMRALAPHFQRALTFGMRLESAAQSERLGLAALDALADGFALVDERGVVRHANAVLEQWLRAAGALRLEAGRLQARMPQANARLAALIADAVMGLAPRFETLSLASIAGPPLNVRAMPVRGAAMRYLPPRNYALLIFSQPRPDAATLLQSAAKRYRLTRAEQRLALHLIDGTGLREASARCGIAYGTARGYLKLLFEKTGTHRQAELVALLLGAGRTDPDSSHSLPV